MMLLRLISWPYVRKHVLRTLLTTAGIVLGVALFVGMHTANQSVLFAFNHTVDRIAGKAELQVSTGEAGFPEEVLETVQAAPSVRVAVPVIEAVVKSGIAGAGSLLVLGVDMTGDRSLRDYELDSGDEAIVDDPLVFLAQPDSIIVTKEFAERSGASIGRELTLATALGERRFTVRGIMKPSGLSSAFGGNLAIMDIFAAQRMFGRGRTFDRIDLTVREGRTVDAARRELTGLLGPGYEVDSPAARGRQFVHREVGLGGVDGRTARAGPREEGQVRVGAPDGAGPPGPGEYRRRVGADETAVEAAGESLAVRPPGTEFGCVHAAHCGPVHQWRYRAGRHAYPNLSGRVRGVTRCRGHTCRGVRPPGPRRG